MGSSVGLRSLSLSSCLISHLLPPPLRLPMIVLVVLYRINKAPFVNYTVLNDEL